MADVRVILERVAQDALKEVFVPSAQTQEMKYDALGIAIAHYAEHSGTKICKIFRSALEDANYHELAGKVEEWLNQ